MKLVQGGIESVIRCPTQAYGKSQAATDCKEL